MRGHDSFPVLIAGGGIGGLGAALALVRKGFRVHILEAAPSFEELGAGLQIGPNGGRILAYLGLGPALDRVAVRPEQLRLMDGVSGRQLAAVPLGRTVLERYGAPYRVMTRHALHGLLAAAALASPQLAISHGFRLRSVTEAGSGGGVIACSENGSASVQGRGLIGADGVHSAVRRLLFPDAGERRSGWTALRAVLHAGPSGPARNHAVTVWMAPDAHLVTYPLNDRGALNLVAVLRDDAVPPGRDEFGGALLAGAFRRWTAEARELVEACPSWRIWPLLTLPPLTSWGSGAVTLLGDAAHPVLPFLASGAVMAIEDAAVLAQEAATTPDDLAAAFRRYEDRRRPRAARIQASSARMGEIYHMSGPMRLARNATLRLLPRAALLARNDWLYGFRV